MIRPLICSIAGLLIALGSCQSLLAQAQTPNPPVKESNSELDSALEKLTSKKAIAEVARYRKALGKLEIDSQKEKGRLRKDLLGQFDIALRTATKDKDYAEVQNLLDARLLLEKAGAGDTEEVGNVDDSADGGKAEDTNNTGNEDQPESERKRPRVPRKRGRSGQDGPMDIPAGTVQGPANRTNLTKAKTFRKNKYLIITESATWHVAHRECKKRGGHLVRVDDAAEQAFLEKLAAAENSKRDMIWIDATDEDVESEWHNSLGEPLPFKNWHNGQPNNENMKEHHAAMRRVRGWEWTDTVATVRARFICEWENVAGQE